MPTCEAYLDIETTGLSPSGCEITVIGIHPCREGGTDFVQLVGKDISADGILGALEGIDPLYTYNGSRFDLPFINAVLGLNLEDILPIATSCTTAGKTGFTGG